MVFHYGMYIIPKATGTSVSEENVAAYEKLNFSQWPLEGLCNFNWKDYKHWKELQLLLRHAAMKRMGTQECMEHSVK